MGVGEKPVDLNIIGRALVQLLRGCQTLRKLVLAQQIPDLDLAGFEVVRVGLESALEGLLGLFVVAGVGGLTCPASKRHGESVVPMRTFGATLDGSLSLFDLRVGRRDRSVGEGDRSDEKQDSSMHCDFSLVRKGRPCRTVLYVPPARTFGTL